MKEQQRWVRWVRWVKVWVDLRFEVIAVDLGEVWRQKAGSTISQKNHKSALLYEKPANSDLHKQHVYEYSIPRVGL